MTTAARPGERRQRAGKDGEQNEEELQKRNLREELEDRELKHHFSKDKSYAEERDRQKRSSHQLLECSKREADDKIVPPEIDADDSDVESKGDDESDEDDDDDDDTEAAQKERAEKLRKERQQAEEEAKMKEAELMQGNLLININNPGSFSVKRRWDDNAHSMAPWPGVAFPRRHATPIPVGGAAAVIMTPTPPRYIPGAPAAPEGAPATQTASGISVQEKLGLLRAASAIIGEGIC